MLYTEPIQRFPLLDESQKHLQDDNIKSSCPVSNFTDIESIIHLFTHSTWILVAKLPCRGQTNGWDEVGFELPTSDVDSQSWERCWLKWISGQIGFTHGNKWNLKMVCIQVSIQQSASNLRPSAAKRSSFVWTWQIWDAACLNSPPAFFTHPHIPSLRFRQTILCYYY